MSHTIITHDVARVVRAIASDPIALATATAWTDDAPEVTVITAFGIVHVVGE